VVRAGPLTGNEITPLSNSCAELPISFWMTVYRIINIIIHRRKRLDATAREKSADKEREDLLLGPFLA
jgi:hypothetical protein